MNAAPATATTNEVRTASGIRRAQSASISTVSLTETPNWTQSLVNSVGVVTHFHYAATPYCTQYTAVRDLLIAARIHHIRDAIETQVQYKPYYGYMADLAANGIRLDGVTQLNEPMSTITEFVTALPNVLESIEAPNEWNLNGGTNWVSDIIANQKALYAEVKASPLTSAIPVIGPSLTSYEAYAAVGNQSAYLDEGNMHNYYGPYNPGNSGGEVFPPGKYNSIPFYMGSAALVSGAKPVATTETGYQDASTDPSFVSPAIKLKYSMRTVLDQFNAHIARTFFYELVDEGGQNYGMIDASLNPKPVYVGLKNLLSKLTDGGTFTAKPLSYSLTADPSVQHMLLQKADGSYRLMLWIETAATDPVQQSQPVTITTATTFKLAVQYAFLDTGSFTTIPLSQNSSGAITLNVSDRVTEVKLQP